MILFPAIKQVRTNPQFLAHFRRAQTIKDHQPHRLFLELGAVTLPSHSSILQLRESHVHFSQATSSKDSLFTEHGMKKAAAWRLVRKLARDAVQIIPMRTEPSKAAVMDFLQDYLFDE